jgi:hypothetical protein
MLNRLWATWLDGETNPFSVRALEGYAKKSFCANGGLPHAFSQWKLADA